MLGRGRGGGVPGVWDDWVAGRGYTGTHPATVPGSHIQVNSASGPYLRPNEGNYGPFHEIPLGKGP